MKKQHYYIFCTHFHIGISEENKYNGVNQSETGMMDALAGQQKNKS